MAEFNNLTPITRREQFLQDIADGTVDKTPITREEWFLAQIAEAVASGGGGSSLPSVTDADNGDVLTVVNGAWDKAAPSGGGDALIESNSGTSVVNAGPITVTTDSSGSGSICVAFPLPGDSNTIRIKIDGVEHTLEYDPAISGFADSDYSISAEPDANVPPVLTWMLYSSDYNATLTITDFVIDYTTSILTDAGKGLPFALFKDDSFIALLTAFLQDL